MDIAALKAELIAGHPDTGAYSTDDPTATVELNAINRTRPLTSLTGSQVLNTMVLADFDSLTASDQARAWNIVHLGAVDPYGIENDMMEGIFGAASATMTAFHAARIEPVSRAVEIGIGSVKTGHVEEARR